MNTKYPFTSAGFADLLAWLYALPNAQLQAEADALQDDFLAWMIAHFLLTPSQEEYLLGLSDETVAFNAESTSYAVRNRLPVYLDKQENPGQAEGGSSASGAQQLVPGDKIKKIIETRNNLTITEDPDGTTAGGSVTVKIEFITLTGGQ